MAFERIFLSVFLDSSLAMMGKTQQGGRFYDSHHDDLHGVWGGGAEPGHTAAAGRYRRTGTLTQVDVDKFSICLYNRSKISRNYWLFEPKCRNNAEITYTQRLQIASYFP